MSENSGVSASYVDAQINSLREQLLREIGRQIDALRDETERAMENYAGRVTSAIKEQTNALRDQFLAQTAVLEVGNLELTATKTQLAKDFLQTRNVLDLQTEATLQIEIGKKAADGIATKGKLEAFGKDIKGRFEKSLEAVALNRQLYNVNFKKIFDEYVNKLRVIGEHIFSIRDNDMAPAMEAATAPLEEIHGLPMEVDLYRLRVRSENLDQALQMLRGSRLEVILTSVSNLERDLDKRFCIQKSQGDANIEGVQAIALVTVSSIATDLLIGARSREVTGAVPVNIVANDDELAPLNSGLATAGASRLMETASFRNPTLPELTEMLNASKRLTERGLISREAAELFADFLGSGNLKVVA